MNNSVHILKRFEKNTDANAPLEGFFFQYLVTLDNWLENYIQNRDVNIYCEVEDDIKIEDLANGGIVFKQVKAYSSSFNINSDEIKKSIANFFLLYEKYKDKTTEFIYVTNTKLEGRFFDLTSKPRLLQSEKDECIKAISDLLESKFNETNDKDLAKIQKEIKDAQDYITNTPNPIGKQVQAIIDRQQLITLKQVEEKKIIDDFNELKIFISSEAPDFVDRIIWISTEKKKEEEIKTIKKSIYSRIIGINEFKDIWRFVYGRLFEIVSDKSQQEKPENRILNKAKLLDVIKEANNVDEFKKMQFSERTNVFLNSIDDSLATIIEKLNQLDYTPIFNSFQNYSEKIFEILNKSDLFDDKVMEVIQEIIPDNILDRFKNQLFYPILNQRSIDDIKGDLSKEKIKNEELWRGWLRFLVFLKVLKGQNINLDDFKIELEIEIKRVLGIITTKKEKIPANLKFIFVTSDNFLKIATLYTKNNLNLVDKYDCCIFNTDKSIFSNTHFTNSHKESILKSITSSSSIRVSKPRDFGIINFKTLLNDIVNCSNITEFEQKFKNILNDAISGQ